MFSGLAEKLSISLNITITLVVANKACHNSSKEEYSYQPGDIPVKGARSNWVKLMSFLTIGPKLVDPNWTGLIVSTPSNLSKYFPQRHLSQTRHHPPVTVW